MTEYRTCEQCGDTFITENTDEEAIAEFERVWHYTPKPEDLAIVCDDCYREIMIETMN